MLQSSTGIFRQSLDADRELVAARQALSRAKSITVAADPVVDGHVSRLRYAVQAYELGYRSDLALVAMDNLPALFECVWRSIVWATTELNSLCDKYVQRDLDTEDQMAAVMGDGRR